MLLNRAISPYRVGPIGFAVIAALVLSSWPCDRAAGQVQPPAAKPATKSDDPRARALFEEICTAYKTLSSYSDDGRFLLAMTVGGRPQKQSIPLKLTFVRPNKLIFDAGPVRVTSDGTTMTTAVLPLKRYATEPAPARIGIETLREGPLGAILFGGPGGGPLAVLLNMLTASDPSAAVAGLGGSLQLGPLPSAPQSPTTPEGSGAKSTSLLIELRDGPALLLRVDPASRLLSAIELKVDPERLAQAGPAGQKVSIESFGWFSGTISTRVAPGQSFAFTAPGGFVKVDSIFAQDEQHAGNDKLEKPAPDFTLTLLDGPGKAKTVTKAELTGTIVVLDFWATSCAPCMMELPEIQQLIEHYAGTKYGVLVVAANQDTDPTEIAEVRQLVEKTLSDKKIRLDGNPVGRIALDPSNSLGRAFGITGYPTLVVIDAKGVVRSVHVGFDPNALEPLHEVLAREIDSLLAGKSQAAPKNVEKAPAAR
jgi:thiol-disulfide isomerase/thioredoxin